MLFLKTFESTHTLFLKSFEMLTQQNFKKKQILIHSLTQLVGLWCSLTFLKLQKKAKLSYYTKCVCLNVSLNFIFSKIWVRIHMMIVYI